MEQATSPDSGRPHVSQTTAALLEEIASLRKQNEEQRRELEQLRAAIPQSLRQLNNNSVQPSAMPWFMLFPFEIREKIWEYALPRRLLGTEDIHQKHIVPTNLPVPTIAHVCRESRSFAMPKNHINALPGEFELSRGQKLSSRLKDPTSACRTWFSPSHDILMIRLQGCGLHWSQDKRSLARVAEDIIVEDPTLWRGFQEYSNDMSQNAFYEQCTVHLLSAFTDWVHHVYVQPYSDNTNSARPRGPGCNLRTADFAMRKVTTIDPNSPPQLLRRIFGSNDVTRAVDVRGTEPAEFLRMLGYELSQGMDPDDFLNWTGELADSLSIYQSVVEKPLRRLGPALLKALASACFEASNMECSGRAHKALANPFLPDGSELDMKVGWVRELSERLTVRPVHVFVLGEDKPENQFTYRSPKRLFPTETHAFE